MDERRFLFLTGKGGVGKTTVTAALALALGRRGKRVLVALCGAHERLSAILGTRPIGHDIEPVGEGIWATKIEPSRAIEEYSAMIIKVRAIHRLVFDNAYTQAFFRAVPGLYEWSMLGKAWYHATEQQKDGSPRFDTVLFDAPSTGHGLDMLRVPTAILGAVPPGVLRRDAERAWQTFRDPALSGVVVVSWPEEMPVTETIELVGALRAELELPVAGIVVNGVWPARFDEAERQRLLGSSAMLELAGRTEPGLGPGEWALSSAVRRALREQRQERSIERLHAELGLPLTVLPYVLEGAGTPEAARRLAAELAPALRSVEPPEAMP